ncbi:MAG: DUF262 domain-containing protein [Chloroflexi bacterium]|nr:DUF262 domain-containing protein [Chloroflexota bacterium]
MVYQADTVATIVNRLNRRYFLPVIQREFVWKPEQVVQLFDSMMRNYPISSFLFWELKDENRDKWEVYKFIDNFRQGGTHNERASTDGVHNLTLVLDGQQRLTSLSIGLHGTYTIKKPHMWYSNPDAWVKQRLYIDVLQDPAIEPEEGETGIRYGFRFMQKAPKNDHQHHWLKVGRILDFDTEESFDRFKDEELERLDQGVTKAQIKVAQKVLDRLYRAVWVNDTIAYYTEHDQNFDRVLDIFVRANEGGTKLSKSDMLLSMVTAKWGSVNAREEIYDFVDRLNEKLTHQNNFDKDFLMKACLVLTDLPVQYKVQNFNNQNLDLIETNWPKIKLAVERAVRLVNSFGIDRDTLTSANALIPIAYYLMQHPGRTALTSSASDVQDASRVRRWLTMALLNNVFGGTSDNMLRDIRAVLQSQASVDQFPIEAINKAIALAGRSASFDKVALGGALDITYSRRTAFLALSLLYDVNSWGLAEYHVDHIFPQQLFQAANLEKSGIPSDEQPHFTLGMNQLANLQILTAQENLEKSGADPKVWLATRDADFKQRHLIPDDPDLLTLPRFRQFLAAREKSIGKRLAAQFADVAALPV